MTTSRQNEQSQSIATATTLSEVEKLASTVNRYGRRRKRKRGKTTKKQKSNKSVGIMEGQDKKMRTEADIQGSEQASSLERHNIVFETR